MALYEEIVKNVTSFMKLSGMFQMKNGMQYKLFENINQNAISWKQYDLSSPKKNQKDIMELKLNISDAALLGSESSIGKSN